MNNREQSCRKVLGSKLKTFRLDRNLTAYAVAKKGCISISQVRYVEEGSSNYTIDTFTGYLYGCNITLSLYSGNSVFAGIQL